MPRRELRATRRSLRSRAMVALGLLVGFYVLAFGIVVAIALIVIWGLRSGHLRVQYVGLVLVAIAILRGVLFLDRDHDRLPPVRIQLRPEQEPTLWTEVGSVAAAVRAPRPQVLYLVHDVNAFVYQESRLLGLRPGRMVLGIGVGLLTVLRVDELRAVLAHEFGHLSSGDTRLGPVVYRAQESIQRTITHLKDNLLGRLFAGYLRLFMGLTMNISRRQELAADINAVRLGGQAATIQALQAVAVTGGAFELLLSQYAAPLWESGAWPADLYGGLRSLCAEPARAGELDAMRAALLAEPTDPWDSHPALAERLRFIASLPPGPTRLDPRPARTLLADPDGSERRMAEQLSALATDGQARTPVSWEQAAQQVYRSLLQQRATALASAGMAVGGDWRRRGLEQALELLEADRGEALARRLVPDLEQAPAEERARLTGQVLRNYLRAAVATELAGRPGVRWVASWAGLAGVVGVHGAGQQLEELVDAALAGPQGVDALRRELGLEWAGV